MSNEYTSSIFINCPFDAKYKKIFYAIVFTIYDCGFIPRCALEEADTSQIRIEKIYNLIANCKYGIHDISRTAPDRTTRLPRFNMPLELGIFLGAKRYGRDKHQREKRCLVLDQKPYRYQKFISDLSGQDIEAHGDKPKQVVKVVRNWIRNRSRRVTVPGERIIWSRYQQFCKDLPAMCDELGLNVDDLLFNDYTMLVEEWLKLQG